MIYGVYHEYDHGTIEVIQSDEEHRKDVAEFIGMLASQSTHLTVDEKMIVLDNLSTSPDGKWMIPFVDEFLTEKAVLQARNAVDVDRIEGFISQKEAERSWEILDIYGEDNEDCVLMDENGLGIENGFLRFGGRRLSIDPFKKLVFYNLNEEDLPEGVEINADAIQYEYIPGEERGSLRSEATHYTLGHLDCHDDFTPVICVANPQEYIEDVEG